MAQNPMPPGYEHLPAELQRYFANPQHSSKPKRFWALPLPPNTPNTLGLWGGVYEVMPHGLVSRALCFEQSWAEGIARRLNRLSGPGLPPNNKSLRLN